MSEENKINSKSCFHTNWKKFLKEDSSQHLDEFFLGAKAKSGGKYGLSSDEGGYLKRLKAGTPTGQETYNADDVAALSKAFDDINKALKLNINRGALYNELEDLLTDPQGNNYKIEEASINKSSVILSKMPVLGPEGVPDPKKYPNITKLFQGAMTTEKTRQHLYNILARAGFFGQDADQIPDWIKKPVKAEPVKAKKLSPIENATKRAEEIAKSDAGQAVEKALEGLSLIPGANIPASIAAAVLNVFQGQTKEAAISLLSLIPVQNKAGKLEPFGPYAVKLASTMGKLDEADKDSIKTTLEKLGLDVSPTRLHFAIETATDMQNKLLSIPGLGEQLASLIDAYVKPLKSSFVADVSDEFEMPDILNLGDLDALLDDEEELLKRAEDPTELPEQPPDGYKLQFKGVVFVSMLKDTDNLPNEGLVSAPAFGENEMTQIKLDNTFALYRDLTANVNFVWSPKLEMMPDIADTIAKNGVNLPTGADPADYVDLDIREALFKRWQNIIKN